MMPHEMQRDQIEMWLALTAEMAEKTSKKKEEDIDMKDVVRIAQKVQDIINVLYGKSKIAGWRL